MTTVYAQAVAIRLHQLRSGSGTTPASVQGFKGTGSLLAQVGGNALGIEQSARMMVKTKEAKQEIDSRYADWKQNVYDKAKIALARRQRFTPGPAPEHSKFKQFTNTLGITRPAPKAVPSFQNEPWLPLVPVEVQQVLDPTQNPTQADFNQANLALDRASVVKLNELFKIYGRFGKKAKGIYKVSATGDEIEKGRNRRLGVGQKQKPAPKQPVATPPTNTGPTTTASAPVTNDTTAAPLPVADAQMTQPVQAPPTTDLDVQGVALPLNPTTTDEDQQ